mgnify:CR=1 FL=1
MCVWWGDSGVAPTDARSWYQARNLHLWRGGDPLSVSQARSLLVDDTTSDFNAVVLSSKDLFLDSGGLLLLLLLQSSSPPSQGRCQCQLTPVGVCLSLFHTQHIRWSTMCSPFPPPTPSPKTSTIAPSPCLTTPKQPPLTTSLVCSPLSLHLHLCCYLLLPSPRCRVCPFDGEFRSPSAHPPHPAIVQQQPSRPWQCV